MEDNEFRNRMREYISNNLTLEILEEQGYGASHTIVKLVLEGETISQECITIPDPNRI